MQSIVGYDILVTYPYMDDPQELFLLKFWTDGSWLNLASNDYITFDFGSIFFANVCRNLEKPKTSIFGFGFFSLTSDIQEFLLDVFSKLSKPYTEA